MEYPLPWIAIICLLTEKQWKRNVYPFLMLKFTYKIIKGMLAFIFLQGSKEMSGKRGPLQDQWDRKKNFHFYYCWKMWSCFLCNSYLIAIIIIFFYFRFIDMGDNEGTKITEKIHLTSAFSNLKVRQDQSNFPAG